MKIPQFLFRLAFFLCLNLVVAACAAPAGVGSVQTPLDSPTTTTTQTATPTLTPTLTATATPTETPTMTPSLTPTPTEMGGSDGILLYAAQQVIPGNFRNWKELGIYQFRLSDHSFWEVAGTEYQMVGLSPDRQYLLALKDVPPSREVADLYRIRISDGEATKIVERAFAWVGTIAYWYPNNLIAFIGWVDGSKHIFTVYPDGSSLTQITQTQTKPVRILPSSVETGICFASGKTSFHNKATSTLIQGSWCIEFNGANLRQISDTGLAAFSLADTSFAYPSPDHSGIEIVTAQGSHHFDTLDPDPGQISYMCCLHWSPDGNKLLATDDYCSPNCSRADLILSPEGVLLDRLTDADTNDINMHYVWSPDGKNLLDIGGSVGYLYDLTTKEITSLDEFIPDDLYLDSPIWGNSRE